MTNQVTYIFFIFQKIIHSEKKKKTFCKRIKLQIQIHIVEKVCICTAKVLSLTVHFKKIRNRSLQLWDGKYLQMQVGTGAVSHYLSCFGQQLIISWVG